MMLDYKKLLESLLRELIDKKIISEWYCNGAGYFWKYNEKDKRIIKLEKENTELKKKIGIYQKGMYDEIEKRDKKLTKAKEIIKNIIEFDVSYEDEEDFERNCELYDKIFEETEQFLKEIEN